MSESMLLSAGSVFATQYRVVRRVEDGAVVGYLARAPEEGAVYVATHTGTGSEQALTLLPPIIATKPHLRERFEKELREATRLGGSVARIQGFGIDPVTNIPWIASEMLSGETLGALSDRKGPMPIAEAFALLEPLCIGLAAAHDAAIVHRALSPEAVLVGADPASLRLLGLGVSKLIAQARGASPTGHDSAWSAPEVTATSGPKLGAVPSNDVWSLGLLAFRLLTGKPYWLASESDTDALRTELLEAPIIAPSLRAAELGAVDAIPSGFDEWFAHCVAREPGKRFADAREAMFDLGKKTGVKKGGFTVPAAPQPAALAQPTAPYANHPPTQAWGGQPPPYGYPPQAPPPYGPQAPWGPRPASSSSGVGIVVAAILGLFFFVMAVAAVAAFVTYKARAKGGPTPVAAVDDDEEGMGAPSGAWSDADSPIPVTSADPSWGSRSAPVTWVVYSDFQCPFCSRLKSAMSQAKATYGERDLRIVWKNNPLPFHKDAKPAATAAMAVFQAKGSPAFWQFHDAAFLDQKNLNDENYRSWAALSGLDGTRFQAALDDGRASAKVEADLAEGKRVGVTGTPASFVNGISMKGAQPFEKFQETIDRELTAARADIATGTPSSRIYVVRSKKNFSNDAPPTPTSKDEGEAADEKTVYNVPVGDSPVRGPATALVTIVEFSDFQCPFCAKVEPTLAQVRSTYGAKVRIVWKNNPLPFHQRAEPAAELALEAKKQKGDEGFWQAHDMLFENQRDLDDGALLSYAARLGLSPSSVASAMSTKRYARSISADQGLADDIGASGTPSFFINGRKLTGAQPFEKFKQRIDEELVKAEGMVARGVPQSGVYAEIIKDGKGPAAMERKVAPPIPPGAPFRGPANAPVVIHLFSDFQCPFCKRVDPTMDELVEAYGTKVKIVWRHKPLPMHKDAFLAAEAAQEVLRQQGNDGFWRYHDKLFENQTSLDRPSLERYAQEIGVDMTRFRRALDEHTHRAAVEAESAAADQAGISGTPAFIINGYFVSGAQPASKFKKVIDRALSEVR